MNNISGGIEVARAAPPPKKTESVQTQKGDDDFKKYLEACSQEDEQKKAAGQPEDEAVKKAAEAAVLLLQVAPAPVEAVQVEIPVSEIESAPIVAAPVVTEEAPVQVEAQAQVEAAPVKAEAAPVQAQAKATTSSFAENLKAAEVKPAVEAPAPAPKAETAPVIAAPVKAPETKAAVEEQPVIKTVKAEAVEEQPVVASSEAISARVAVDVSAARVETRPLELVRQMSKEITGIVAAGKNELHIQIQPENMGRIDVRLVSNSDGMQVVLTADSPATGKMLESNLSQLQKSLSDAGLTISGMSVNSQGTQGQFSNTFRDQTQSIPQYYPKQMAVAAVPVEAISARYSNPLSGFDFRA